MLSSKHLTLFLSMPTVLSHISLLVSSLLPNLLRLVLHQYQSTQCCYPSTTLRHGIPEASVSSAGWRPQNCSYLLCHPEVSDKFSANLFFPFLLKASHTRSWFPPASRKRSPAGFMSSTETRALYSRKTPTIWIPTRSR